MKAIFSKGIAYVGVSYRCEDGMTTTRCVERIGKLTEIQEKYGCEDPKEWCRSYVRDLTEKKQAEELEIIRQKQEEADIVPDDFDNSRNYGYLYLRRVFSILRLDEACAHMSKDRKMEYDMEQAREVLSYGMVLWPGSRPGRWENREGLLGEYDVEYHDLIRSLGEFSERSAYLQRFVFRNLGRMRDRRLDTVYFDCYNYYCCTDDENRKSPIVGLATVVDGEGLSLCAIPYWGNMNEQLMYPQIVDRLEYIGLRNYTLCSDAGLGSLGNRARLVLDREGRSYVTVVSPRSQWLDPVEQAWYISSDGWWWYDNSEGTLRRNGGVPLKVGPVDISALDPQKEEDKGRLFYKSALFVRRYRVIRLTRVLGTGEVKTSTREGGVKMTGEEVEAFMGAGGKPTKEVREEEKTYKNGGSRKAVITTYTFCEKAVVRFSMAARICEREKRNEKLPDIADGKVTKIEGSLPARLRRSRYVKDVFYTEQGEVASQAERMLDRELLDRDELYDGFYVIVTDHLEKDEAEIASMNSKGWMSEDEFRLGKSFPEVRPPCSSAKARA